MKHIKFQKELYPTGRFPHVFTKLHAVGMEKYDKVIVLDTDVLIRNDMDEPFERQTPAAVRRHPQRKYLDFAEIDCRDRLLLLQLLRLLRLLLLLLLLQLLSFIQFT